MTNNTGGPAFPEGKRGGMTLRDYFAAKAMNVVVLEVQETVPASVFDWFKQVLRDRIGMTFLYVRYRVVDGAHDSAASRAYAMADAMLKERSK